MDFELSVPDADGVVGVNGLVEEPMLLLALRALVFDLVVA